MAGFGAAVDDAGRPAGEHHEHSGARNRQCGARRCFANFFEWVAEAPEGRASSASAAFGGGGVCGLAPGFYLRCSTVGAAPKIRIGF